MNLELIRNFEKLKKHYDEAKDKGRSIAYNKALLIIKSFKVPIVSSVQLQNIKGIGSTILSKIDEFLTNKSAVSETKKENDVRVEFEKIWGIGPVKAEKLFSEHKIFSIDQLVQNQFLLTDQQKIGLKYFKELQLKVPRKIIELFENQMKTIFENKIIFKITGSYRRKKIESGDVDCVIYSKRYDLEKCVSKLIESKIVIDTLSMRNEKFLGVAKINNCVFRLDIEFVPKESFGSAVLYFTGSKEFNIIMRGEAKRLGYLLNEHGLFQNGKQILDSPSEKDIFQKLGMDYVKPENR